MQSAARAQPEPITQPIPRIDDAMLMALPYETQVTPVKPKVPKQKKTKTPPREFNRKKIEAKVQIGVWVTLAMLAFIVLVLIIMAHNQTT